MIWGTSQGFSFLALAVSFGAIADGMFCHSALADTRRNSYVQWNPQSGEVIVNARNLRPQQILHEVAKRLQFTVSGRAPNNSRTISGRIKGAPNEILNRLLGDTSFVLVTNVSGGIVRLIIYANKKSNKIVKAAGNIRNKRRHLGRQVDEQDQAQKIEQMRKQVANLEALSLKYEGSSDRVRRAKPKYAKRLAAKARQFTQRADVLRQTLQNLELEVNQVGAAAQKK